MKHLIYKGAPVEQLSREELIGALEELHGLYVNEHLHFMEILRLTELKYKPKTWLGKLLNVSHP